MYKHRSIAAGLMIGLAAMLNLKLEGGLLGALAFGLGLLTVCALQLDLFTGKMRALLKGDIKIREMILVLIGNAIGIMLAVILCASLPASINFFEGATSVMNARAGSLWFLIILRGMLCGVCVQMAVDMYRETKNILAPMLSAAAFVLLGCNHCIADMFYFVLGGQPYQIIQIFYALIGNVLGAGLFVCASSGTLHRSNL